jgi:TolA-binding protein
MFNSISNWVKENVPEGTIPNLFNDKNEKELVEIQKKDNIPIDNAKEEDGEENKEITETSAKEEDSTQEESTKKEEEESNLFDFQKLDANKAREIGANISNMLFSFGKSASENVLKSAKQLNEALEKYVNIITMIEMKKNR